VKFTDTPNINLGAGNRILKRDGWLNHDRSFHRDEIDCAWDLNVMPYPWMDDTFQTVRMFDVLEHLDKPLVVMAELWRILKSSGVLHMRVVGEDSKTRWRDPTHQRPFNVDSFDFLDPSTRLGKDFGFYSARHWNILFKQVDTAGSLEYKMTPIK